MAQQGGRLVAQRYLWVRTKDHEMEVAAAVGAAAGGRAEEHNSMVVVETRVGDEADEGLVIDCPVKALGEMLGIPVVLVQG